VLERFGQRRGEGLEVGGAPGANPDAAVERRDAGHAHEDVALDEPPQHPAGEIAVAAAVDGDEIGARRQRLEPVRRRDPRNRLARRGDLSDDMREIRLDRASAAMRAGLGSCALTSKWLRILSKLADQRRVRRWQ
jgi:hypothetical protein